MADVNYIITIKAESEKIEPKKNTEEKADMSNEFYQILKKEIDDLKKQIVDLNSRLTAYVVSNINEKATDTELKYSKKQNRWR